MNCSDFSCGVDLEIETYRSYRYIFEGSVIITMKALTLLILLNEGC